MAKKTFTLTDEHIKLLQAIKFEAFTFDGDSREGRIGWGIDQYAPWGGNFPIEDIALILGHFDKAMPGTENDYNGRKWPVEMHSHFIDLYEFITENIDYLFSLIIYFTDKGGLTPGTYSCNPRIKEWVREEDNFSQN